MAVKAAVFRLFQSGTSGKSLTNDTLARGQGIGARMNKKKYQNDI
jgi:hypothetical protein